MRARVGAWVACAVVAATAPASAHHSWVMCDETRVKTVQGTIAKVEWSNPKLVKSAGVRALDLYSLRHTFATLLGRTAGESAFNVARMMGHSRSLLVD